jgi:hypothetical protein
MNIVEEDPSRIEAVGQINIATRSTETQGIMFYYLAQQRNIHKAPFPVRKECWGLGGLRRWQKRKTANYLTFETRFWTPLLCVPVLQI